jgi:hypothetical protein
MATGLKRHYPDIRFSGNYVTPDEIDRYELYTIFNPALSTAAWGTAVGTSTQAKAVVFDQVIPDYPRALQMIISCASGSTKGGTATINGYDQFGNAISETFGGTVIADGGTYVGTKVFAKVTSPGTFTMGTSNAGNGTVTFGPTCGETAALFGLPAKIGGSDDIRVFNFGTNSVPVNVGGGTYGAFVSTALHAVYAPKNIGNTGTWFSIWYRPTYNAENDVTTKMSNL